MSASHEQDEADRASDRPGWQAAHGVRVVSVRGVHEEQEVSERIDVKKMEVEVGRLMLRVPIVASALGHESPGITAINYLDREGWPGSRESALAAEFISDFIEWWIR